jgi:hypothetical protein
LDTSVIELPIHLPSEPIHEDFRLLGYSIVLSMLTRDKLVIIHKICEWG